MHKKRFSQIAFSAVIAGFFTFAWSEPSLTISGELSDMNDQLIGTQAPESLSVIVNIYDQQSGGSPLYTETFLKSDSLPIIVNKGLFQVHLGSGRSNGSLKDIVSAKNDLWVECVVDNDVLTRAPLTAAPHVILNTTHTNVGK